MSKARNSEGCTIDMTPMIDVVFQMIIFFIVTITITEAKDKDVKLEYGPNGEPIETKGEKKASVIIIDVGKKGRVSINNQDTSETELYNIIKRRVDTRKTEFQVWIRGDYETPHAYVRRVMDICSKAGHGRVHIISIKDPRTPATKESFQKRGINWRR